VGGLEAGAFAHPKAERKFFILGTSKLAAVLAAFFGNEVPAISFHDLLVKIRP